jgi:hypothetical protein
MTLEFFIAAIIAAVATATTPALVVVDTLTLADEYNTLTHDIALSEGLRHRYDCVPDLELSTRLAAFGVRLAQLEETSRTMWETPSVQRGLRLHTAVFGDLLPTNATLNSTLTAIRQVFDRLSVPPTAELGACPLTLDLPPRPVPLEVQGWQLLHDIETAATHIFTRGCVSEPEEHPLEGLEKRARTFSEEVRQHTTPPSVLPLLRANLLLASVANDFLYQRLNYTKQLALQC